ncbi:MAG: DUF3999 domain-containing protein [Betaproteobacteria bacterium]
MKTFVCLCLLAGAVHAAPAPSPRDFAFAVPLSAEGDSAFFDVQIPAAAYAGVTRGDLGDMRVFNGDGALVPFAMVPRVAPAREARPKVTLPIFPLRVAAPVTDASALALSVQRSPSGAFTINLNTRDGKPADGDRLIGYIVDLAALNRQPLASLSLQWATLPRGMGMRVRVDASDDLVAWRTLVSDAPLIDLEADGRRLQRNTFDLPQAPARYLRLTWPADQPPLALIGVSGQLADRVVAAPLQWAEATAVAVAEHEGDYEFDLAGMYPVERIELVLPELNTVVPAVLSARNGAQDPWHVMASEVVYRLRQGDADVTSPAIVIAPTAARYWRVHVDPATGGLGTGLPKLRAGWLAQHVVFAARGSAPFMLAYGSTTVPPSALAVRTLVPGYGTADAPPIGAAVAQAALAVAGSAAQLTPAVDWKRWALWLSLLLGVAVLATMAWRLSRELQQAAPDAVPRDDGAPVAPDPR